MLFAPVQAAFLDDGIARPPEVCVGITQMRQKSISRFLTLGITLSIAGAGFSPRIGRQGICFTCTHSRSWVICATAAVDIGQSNVKILNRT